MTIVDYVKTTSIKTWENAWLQLKRSFRKYWFFYFIIFVMAYLITSYINPDMKELLSDLDKNFKEDAPEKGYWETTLFLFKNNWLVCLQILMLSFIPIRHLYVLPLISTCAMIGMTLYLVQQVELNILHTFGLGFLPHAILELTTFMLAAIYANTLNKTIVTRLTNAFRKVKKSTTPFRFHLKEAFSAFIFVITPCIFIAAFIEGFISKFLLTSFL
ncbi:stage II sporulation protein M [Mesobacillus jeotgali]|uniref:stage II sporulation protein M n=1 Tax=Mesobacillus jeotgali TaxID=129985 RepID=UPI000C853F99|nr:stage II sporulation protein M [Mesobacillus jeotgali]